MHPNAETVQAALHQAEASGEVRELDESTRTAAEAAEALGCSIGAIVKSMVFLVDQEPVLVLTSGAHRVDTEYVAAQIGAESIGRASAEEVRESTGQPIGGVAPLGHPKPVRTFVDVALEEFPVVWAAAGTPRAVFPTSFDELMRICSARPVEVIGSGS